MREQWAGRLRAESGGAEPDAGPVLLLSNATGQGVTELGTAIFANTPPLQEEGDLDTERRRGVGRARGLPPGRAGRRLRSCAAGEGSFRITGAGGRAAGGAGTTSTTATRSSTSRSGCAPWAWSARWSRRDSSRGTRSRSATVAFALYPGQCPQTGVSLCDGPSKSTCVVKLGSTLVADDAAMCAGGAAGDLPAGRRAVRRRASVVLVTSGAIALGMRLMGMPVRPDARWRSCRPPRRSGRGRCTTSTRSCSPSTASRGPGAADLLRRVGARCST